MALEMYNDLLDRLQRIDTNIDDYELDILELFAQTESLTITQIRSIIKLTELQIAYKNVRSKIYYLKSLNLIEEAQIDRERRRHNEKYFKLRDEGIYLLFLKRLRGILVYQLSAKKGETPVSYVYNFKFHGGNSIFRLFLYPYLGKQTIFVDNFELLVSLFNYVHDCCKQLDLALRIGAVVSVMIPIFSWNKIPGQDELGLLTSLKEIFILGDIDKDNPSIKKAVDDSAIRIITPQIRILIRLDLVRRKAIATVDVENRCRTYEYEIANLGREIVVCTTRPPEESLKKALDTRRLIQVPIYELVSNIGY